MNPNMSPNPGPPGGEPSLKVIKVGANSPARIAQACDRCRSKKIRCDGITPRCSQCAAVGFECKTSDKLSRRAFPRGYTETLEERVRQLEQENRDLKAACEEKDERLMMLSRYSTGTAHVASPVSRGGEAFYGYDRPPQSFDVHGRAVASPNGQSGYITGSNGAALFEALKRKSLDMYQKALPAVNDPSIYFQPAHKMAQSDGSRPTQLPDRMVSDRLINSFVQEWLTVFPVMLRQAALGSYQEICNNPAGLGDHQNVAQIFLMFDLGASGVGIHPEWVPTFEAYWQGALMNVINNNTLETLQSLVLASICCATKRDNEKTAYYITQAVEMAYRLGLHQEPTMPLDIMSSELRKRIWWSLYTVDVFVAAILGTEQQIKDVDVSVTLPLETDEDHLQSNMSSAMQQNMGVPRVIPAFALFRASRLLSRAIHELYPPQNSSEIQLTTVYGLMDELEGWRASLPHYNRLSFAQGRPVDSTVCPASAILAVVYYFVQSLIIRRVALGSAGVPNDTMTGMMTHADAAKQTISTVSLMEDQGYSFAFCINKKDLLVTCGLAVLFQTLDLKPGGRLIKDNWITLQLINRSLDHMPGGSVEFQRITKYIIPNDPLAGSSPIPMNGQQQQIQDANQFSAHNMGLALQMQEMTPRGRGQTAQMGQSPYAHLGYSPNPNAAQSPYEAQGQFGVKNEYAADASMHQANANANASANDGSSWDGGYENGLQISTGYASTADDKPMSLGAAASSYPVRLDLATSYQPFTTARHSKRYRTNPQQHGHNISSSPSIGSIVGASPLIGGGAFGVPEVRASRSDLSLSDESLMSYGHSQGHGGFDDMHLVQAHNSSPMRGDLEDVRVWSMRGPGGY